MGLLQAAINLVGTFWIHAVLGLIVVHLARNRYKPVLRDIPGPYLASLSGLWLLFHCLRGKSQSDWKLHQKYNSPLLRLAPNVVSVADGEAVRVIYGWKPVLKKSRLYISQHQTSSAGEVVTNLSSTMDEDAHAKIRRPVAHAYALSELLEYEPLVDSTSAFFMKQMDQRFAISGQVCDLSQWLQMYAFDVIGELTFSRRFGFLDTGKDLEQMMHHTMKAMDYIGVVGQVPTVDEWLRIKGFGHILRMFRPTGKTVQFTMRQIHEHTLAPQSDAKGTRKNPDFLARFIAARERYPDIMTDGQLAEYANTNVSAGSDTTAIVLRELVWRILTVPEAYEKVMDEINAVLASRRDSLVRKNRDSGEEAGNDHDSDSRPVTYTEGQSMGYFQALIKECLRLHPALGQLIPRDVPRGGLTLCDVTFPAGTVVGCNAWTVHRDKNIYGADAEEFRPERWLADTEEDKKRIRYMENLSFAFGGGPRVCIGRNIAMLEITKFVPELFRRFDLSLVERGSYRLRCGWLVTQEGLEVTLKRRADGEQEGYGHGRRGTGKF